jgi:hypothetical protein
MTIPQPHELVHLLLLHNLLLIDMEDTARPAGSVPMETEPTELAADPHASHLSIDVEDLGQVNAGGYGSIGSAETDVKPEVRLPVESPASRFYLNVLCTSTKKIVAWEKGYCPWCLIEDENDSSVLRRCLLPFMGGKKIKVKRDLTGNFLAKAWSRYDGGFLLRELQRRLAVQSGSPSPINTPIPLANMVEEESSLYALDHILIGAQSDELAPFCGERNCLQSTYATWLGRGQSDRHKYWKEVPLKPQPIDEKSGKKDEEEKEEVEEEEKEKEGEMEEEVLLFKATEKRTDPHCSICSVSLDRIENPSIARYVPKKAQSLLGPMRSMWMLPPSASDTTLEKEVPAYLGELNSFITNGTKSMDLCNSCNTLLTKRSRLKTLNPKLSAFLDASEALQDLSPEEIFRRRAPSSGVTEEYNTEIRVIIAKFVKTCGAGKVISTDEVIRACQEISALPQYIHIEFRPTRIAQMLHRVSRGEAAASPAKPGQKRILGEVAAMPRLQKMGSRWSEGEDASAQRLTSLRDADESMAEETLQVKPLLSRINLLKTNNGGPPKQLNALLFLQEMPLELVAANMLERETAGYSSSGGCCSGYSSSSRYSVSVPAD